MANEQTIANLIVKLSAQTVELASGLKKAEGLVGNFKTAAVRILGGLSLAGIGIGLARGVRDAQLYAAEMAKLAEKTNTNIEVISSLADAADDLGVSAEQLANGIKFLGKSAWEATNAAGPQREAFKALGVEYESMPGVVRPTIDVLLDVSDALKNMEGDARRNPLAMAVMSRGFMDMIPLMTKGREALLDWMASSKDAGKVIDAYTGKAARQFNVDLSNLKDNVQGLAIAVMGDLLPSVSAGIKKLLEWSASMKDLHSPISLLTDTVKALAIVTIPLLAAKLLGMIGTISVVSTALEQIAFARAIGGFSTLALAVANAGYILKAFAVSVLGPLLLNPITLVAAALGGLAFLWIRLGKATEEARIEHEKYVAAISSMDLGTAQAEIAKYQAYLNTLANFIRQKHEELDRETTAFGQAAIGKVLDQALKYQTEALARLDLLKKQADKTKIEPKIDTNTQAMEKIIGKTKEYENALVGLVNPAAGARAAVKAFEDEIRRTVAVSPELESALGRMWAAFNRLQAATEKKALTEAIDKRSFSESVQAVEADMQRLEVDYKAGLVSLESYHAQRMALIRKQVAAEVAFLEKQKLPGLPESKKVEIDTSISERRAAGERKITDEVTLQSEAYRNLRADQREGDLAGILDRNIAAVAELTQQYEDGLVSITAYYAERRRLAAEAAGAEEEEAGIQVTTAKPEDREAAINRLNAIRRKATADKIALDREEVMSSRAAVAAEIQIRADYLSLLSSGSEDGLAAMRLQGQAELALLEQRELDEIAQLNAHLAEKTDAEMSFNEKRQAMEDLYAAQDLRRKKTTADQERAIDAMRLQNSLAVAQGMGNIFGQIYAMGGQKMKAFFYLQKAMAIAEITIQAALGAMKAVGQLGPFGIPMSSVIWGMAATNIAIVMAQTIKGMFRGGPVTGGSGAKDDVPAMLTRGEYVQPEPTVRYYGTDVMEAIRRRVIPRDILKGFGYFPVARPQFAFEEGGAVSGRGMSTTNNFVDVGGVNVSNGDRALGSKMLKAMEETAIRVMKEHTR
jgi:hypothetical protein